MVFPLTHKPGGRRWPTRRGTSALPARTRPKQRVPSTRYTRVRRSAALTTEVARRAGSWRRELLLLIVLYLAYAASRLLSFAPADAAVRNANWLLDLQSDLRIVPEKTLNDLLFSAPTWVEVLAAYFYQSMHYLMTVVTLIWLYRSGSAVYRRARNWLVAMTFPALIAYWLFPVAPPRFIPGAVDHDIVAEQHQYGWWGGGGGTAPRGLSALVNENAAMPSLHVGWAIWVGWNLVKNSRNRAVRCFGYVYPALTILVVIFTGNHYVLDVIAGAFLALAAKIALDRFSARSRRRSAAAHAVRNQPVARYNRSAVAVRRLERKNMPRRTGGKRTRNTNRPRSSANRADKSRVHLVPAGPPTHADHPAHDRPTHRHRENP